MVGMISIFHLFRDFKTLETGDIFYFGGEMLRQNWTNILTIAILILALGILIFFVINPVIGMFHEKYEGYVAFAEKKEGHYVVLILKEYPKKDIEEYSDSDLEQLAQERAKDYGTKGNYFSISGSDYKKIKKGDKVIITYKKQAGPDVWGYAIKAASIKIIEE